MLATKMRALAMAGCLAVGASAWAATPAFDFHNAELLNLHHFLYDLASNGKAVPAGLAGEDARQLDAALSYYRREFKNRPMLFDDGLEAIKVQLSAAPDEGGDLTRLALDPGLRDALVAARGPYQRCCWAEHRAGNTAWIEAVRVLDARHGPALARALAAKLGGAFPERIRVDLVAHSGDFAGAFSSAQPPQSVISSAKPAFQGDAALEMLYHEATHTGPVAPLFEALAARAAQRGRVPPRNLWHALQFYTVGMAVKAALQQAGQPGYQPYAWRQGVFRRAWPTYLPAIEQHWQRYLDGQLGLEAALDALLDAIPDPAPTRS